MSGQELDRGPMEDIATSAEAAEAAVFPDAGVVLTDGCGHSAAERQPLPEAMADANLSPLRTNFCMWSSSNFGLGSKVSI